MMKNNNQMLNKILILIIIINLFASIFIIFGNDKVKENETFEISNFEELTETYKYSQAHKRYKEFVNDLINKNFDKLYDETNNLSDTELKEYYEKNSKIQNQELLPVMQNIYGISEYDTFYTLISKIRNIKEKDAKYKSCKIIKNSCELQSKNTISELEIKYSKFQKITLSIKMLNIVQEDSATFTISVKEEK